MDPITAGIASGAASGGLGLIGTMMTNQANQSNVQSQENYQTQMSDTAYQRQVADMKAAGLNPMFAMGSGGASTPQGSVAQMNNPGPGLQSAVSGGMQAYQQQQQQNANINNANKSTNADVLLKAAQTAQANAQTKATSSLQPEKDVTGKIFNAISSGIDSLSSSAKDAKDRYQKFAPVDSPAMKRLESTPGYKPFNQIFNNNP